MIRTCSYNNNLPNLFNTYSISGDMGRSANYNGKCFLSLAPKLSFWRIWKDNIGKIDEAENTKYYIKEYWNEVLSKLDPEKVYKELDNSILLCYEDSNEFCHRHIVADWFELMLGVKVPEVIIKNGNLEEVERPQYIKKYLEDTIRFNKNMRGFKSIRALYLFESGEKLELKAQKLENKTGKNYDYYRQQACFFRCEADMVEDEYKENKNIKKLVK